MRMTTLSKTHFQNAPTGQKSTGRQFPRHSGTVKLKWNFENEVGKTIDFLNRKTEKSWWKKWTESELPPSMPTSIALSCAKREVCTRHHPLPYHRQYINFVNLPAYIQDVEHSFQLMETGNWTTPSACTRLQRMSVALTGSWIIFLPAPMDHSLEKLSACITAL